MASPPDSLAGRVALVTGAASGIGLGVADRLAEDGADIALIDREADRLAEAARTVEAHGRRALILPADVTDTAAMDRAVAQTADRLGLPTICVASAGIGVTTPLMETAPEDFTRVLAVNVTGLFITLKAVAGALIGADAGGRLIAISSVSGLRGSANRAAYGPSKAAVNNLVEVAAVELARHGITVNAVAPGPVDTPLSQAMHSPAMRASWVGAIPQGRYATVAEIAGAVAFLAGPDAVHITGQILAVDGGYAGAGLLGPIDT